MGNSSNPVADPPRDVPPERIKVDFRGQSPFFAIEEWKCQHGDAVKWPTYVLADLAPAPAGVGRAELIQSATTKDHWLHLSTGNFRAVLNVGGDPEVVRAVRAFVAALTPQDAAVAVAAALAVENMINEPPRRYTFEPIEVREYRHDLYPVWSKFRDAALAAIRTGGK